MSAYNIIYGYNEEYILDNLKNGSNGVKTIVIEPRKEKLDQIQSIQKTFPNVITIKKCLVSKTKIYSTLLFNTGTNSYSVPADSNSQSYGISVGAKQEVFATTFSDIMLQYKIGNVTKLVFNINVDNINAVLEKIMDYNQIISSISFNNSLFDSPPAKSLVNFERVKDQDEFTTYDHKNLHIPLPSLCMHVENESLHKLPPDMLQKFDLFKKQYNIHVYKTSYTLKKKIYYYDYICHILKDYFANDNDHEIFFLFNSAYLKNNYTFPILYPVKNDTLYVNESFDIFYGSKSCMFMLYQLLTASNFKEFIASKKKALLSIFAKKYTMEYLSQVFTLKTITS
jgi:hypothetical protein